MITTEYRVAGSADISIAIMADLHEFDPEPVLDILRAYAASPDHLDRRN